MRVVLDTNVLLSALISPGGKPDLIYRQWSNDRFELITSKHQIDELRRASRYPKFRTVLQPHKVGTAINDLTHAEVLDRLPALPKGIALNDPDDVFLAVMALAADADYLVTGDRRAGLLQLGSIGRARIVTPAEFYDVLG